MRITREEAVEMYARYWMARHKQHASKLARKVVTSLEHSGALSIIGVSSAARSSAH